MKWTVLTGAIGTFVLVLFLANQNEMRHRMDALHQKHRQTMDRLKITESELSLLKNKSSNHDHSLTKIQDSITRTASQIETLEEQEHARVGDLEQTIARRLDDLKGELTQGVQFQQMVQQELDTLKHAVDRDLETLSENILHPSVKITYKTSVGGGTILYSRKNKKGRVHTYILTAYHVVHKAVEVKEKEKEEIRRLVDVHIYSGSAGESPKKYPGSLIVYDEKKDLAVLRVETEAVHPRIAKLLPRDQISQVRVFTPIYAVGCPLGHDPIPTLGEVANLNKKVGGERFFMMNAPTIFGNSGGGIFQRETHQLLGISAMVCTYENLLSTPVPHLGIFISMDTIYDWLDAEDMQFLYDPSTTQEACDDLRKKNLKEKADLVKVIWEE